MLAELNASHTTIVDEEVYRSLRAELSNRRSLTHGVLIEESEPGFFFVRALYARGRAEKAGLRRGDRVVLVNGSAPDRSEWVVDAGYDPALPHPPLYFLRARSDAPLRLRVQSHPDPGSRRTVVLSPRVTNAVEAVAGSRQPCIRIASRSSEDGRWEVAVIDNGPGISADVEARAFESFVTTKDAGTGLGLAIVKRIVDLHGGTARLSREPGGGTRASFWIPAQA